MQIVEQLRAAYNNITGINPDGAGYKALIAYLDKQDQDTLEVLAFANIKFVSSLALNRCPKAQQQFLAAA